MSVLKGNLEAVFSTEQETAWSMNRIFIWLNLEQTARNSALLSSKEKIS